MEKFKRFEEIQAWQLGKRVAIEVYKITDLGTFSRDFGLRNQIRRAAVSISSNVAEGNDRDGNREASHFLSIAKGSAAEVRSLLNVARDVGYLDEEDYRRVLKLCFRASGALEALRRSIGESDLQGRKYGTGTNSRSN